MKKFIAEFKWAHKSSISNSSKTLNIPTIAIFILFPTLLRMADSVKNDKIKY